MLKNADNGSAELYEKFRHGDMEAFEALVIAYRQSLMLFINRYVNNIDTAEDLAEDVFVRLLTKKPKYTGDASFKTWLFTVGRNISLDCLRKQRRIVPTEDTFKGSTEYTEDTVLQSERKRILYEALDFLERDEQLIMHLIYIEDLGYDHAQKVLGVSRKELYAISRRAKDKLKTALLKEGIEF